MNLPKLSFFDDVKIDLWIKKSIHQSDAIISGLL